MLAATLFAVRDSDVLRDPRQAVQAEGGTNAGILGSDSARAERRRSGGMKRIALTVLISC
jgi:hypothetical protein